MPSGDVRDATPGRHPGPQLGLTCRHQHRCVPAAGNADAIDSIHIDRGLGLGKLDGAADIGNDKIRPHGLGRLVDAAKIRMDERPTGLLTPLRILHLAAGLSIVARPGVQCDEQRDRLFRLGNPDQCRLHRIVTVGSILDFTDTTGIIRYLCSDMQSMQQHRNGEQSGGMIFERHQNSWALGLWQVLDLGCRGKEIRHSHRRQSGL